jgi:hypothetical protein
MMDGFSLDRDLIGRLRLRCMGGDRPSAQPRIENLLRGLCLHPRCLAPRAILCIRKLVDPRPGLLTLSHEALGPQPEWERAIGAAIEQLARRAVRPWREFVPETADAVLFTDRAEMLACLALDWMSGTLLRHWWWFELLRGLSPKGLLVRRWTEAPECVPAALEMLALRSSAVPFMRKLPEEMIRPLADGMMRVHGLRDPDRVRLAGHDGISGRRRAASRRGGELEEHAAAAASLPPWLPWVPEASACGLPRPKQELLAHALMLRRRPATARAPAFLRAVADWREACRTAPEPATDDRKKIEPPRRFDQSVLDVTPASLRISDRPAGRAVPSLKAPATAPFTSPPPTTGPSDPHAGLTEQRQPTPDLHATHSGSRVGESDPDRGIQEFEPRTFTAASVASPNSTAPGAAGAATLPRGEMEIATEHAGVFFLLNLAIFLNLYADFTSPHDCGLELNIWDFLALLGAEFVPERFQQDSVWRLLAELAGRGEWEAPGQEFHAPGVWRIPDDWLAPFPETVLPRLTVRDSRFIVRHCAGFPIVDVPMGDQPEADSSLCRWLGWIVPYIRARLVRGVGFPDAAERICSLPGRISWTPTAVDVAYCLDTHPIEIRLAALDRDPGWIPSAGRHVAFHFA